MPEWLKGADCKSAASCYVGSNPTRPSIFKIENFYNFILVNIIRSLLLYSLKEYKIA